MQNNLTSLTRVTEWLGNSTVNDNVILTRLIGQASRFIHGHLRRPSLFKQSHTEILDGNGEQKLYLRHWPVLSITSLTINGDEIAASPGYGEDGYRLAAWDGFPPGGPQAIHLTGDYFNRGRSNVEVTYTAGYAINNEAKTVPGANYTLQVDAPHGSWAVDQGVTYANGTALTKVASGPVAGQYSVDSQGNYTFAAADSGQSVRISYSYVPSDLEHLCIELVAERYRYKDRVGQSSKTLGSQETTAFLITDLTPYLKALARPYMDYGLA